MSKIVILGGGLTGISAAYHLEQAGFYDYVMYEKESEAGGLCRSVNKDGFTFDYTGHLLHINDDYLDNFVDNLIGKSSFNKIFRRSFIQSYNALVKFPYQIHLNGLPSDVIAECIEGFVTRKPNENPLTFEEWVLTHFGEGLLKHFFKPFQSKLFSYDIEQVTASWTGRFVPQTSLSKMIDGAINPSHEESVGYNSTFFYPKFGGIYSLVKPLLQELKNSIKIEHTVESIDLENKIITFANGEFTKYEFLINTIPLDIFLSKVIDKTSTKFQSVADNLLCNSVANFNLGINRPDLTEKHWIYYPENEYPYYRLGFPHNFAESMAPEGCSSLYGEMSYTKHDQKPSIEHAIDTVKKSFGLDDSEIIMRQDIHISHAYVLYTHWREQNLPKLLSDLETHSIHSIGRYGGWKYSSMQESILDGRDIAHVYLKKAGIQPNVQPGQSLTSPFKQKGS